jgi:uncharacterized membrane protein required for colicin V production
MDYNTSGHPAAGLPLLFTTGIAELIRRYTENATVQDIASMVSIVVGTLAAIYYLITIGEKVRGWFKKAKN